MGLRLSQAERFTPRRIIPRRGTLDVDDPVRLEEDIHGRHLLYWTPPPKLPDNQRAVASSLQHLKIFTPRSSHPHLHTTTNWPELVRVGIAIAIAIAIAGSTMGIDKGDQGAR